MSVGPMGMAGSAAGSQLAQSQGTDVNRTQQETADQARQLKTNEKAENAAGIGQTEQDEETSDRDADGRRPWEISPKESQDESVANDAAGSDKTPRNKDASGQRGNRLDLSG